MSKLNLSILHWVEFLIKGWIKMIKMFKRLKNIENAQKGLIGGDDIDKDKKTTKQQQY